MSRLVAPFFLSSLLSFLCLVPARAGGPFKVNGQAEPMAWDSAAAIHYQPDQGPLGQLNNTAARALVAEAFQVWEATGVVSFVADPVLPVDVDRQSFPEYLFCGAGQPCRTDGLSPVVFDADGSIIDEIFGPGARFEVLGLGGIQTDTAVDPTIAEAAVVINGAFFDGLGPPDSPVDLSLEAFKAALVHEIGHFLNLDHSALNGELVLDGDPDNDIYVPTMYPTSSDDDAALASLNPDDEAALRSLYSAVAPVTGIHGRVQVENASLPETLHFQGANVVLRKSDDPLMTAYSMVSGALFFPCEPGGACYPCTASCAANPTARGQFAIDFIEPGSYTACVEQLDRRLGVGPLDPRAIVPGPEECHDAGESPLASADDPDDATLADAASMPSLVLRLNDLPLSDPHEPNDTRATASPLLDLPSGRDTVGAVLGAGDLDHYAIPVLAGDRVRVDVDAFEIGYLDDLGLDPVIGLYDPGGALLAIGGGTFVDDSADPDSAGDTRDPAFEITVGFSGTATLVVSSFPDLDLNGVGGDTTGPYWLRVVVDRDADGDGVVDRLDRCPADALDDADDDGVCGEVDTCVGNSDPDGDGVPGPCIVEAGWVLTRTISFADPIGAHYNPLDGKLYVGRRGAGTQGLYRIESDGSAVALWTGDDIASVLVDPADGDVFASDDVSGEIFRTAFGGTGRGVWVAGFHSGDDDPVGMAIVPQFHFGSFVPGEGLVVDRGTSGTDEVWSWSPAAPGGETQLFPDDGTLVDAVDVAVDDVAGWLVDTREGDTGAIYPMETLTPLATSEPIQEPSGITIDPRGGDLLVLDAGSNGGSHRAVRVDWTTGQVTPMITQLDLSSAEEWAGLDVTPGGSALFVTDRAADRIYVFERDRDGDGTGDGADFCVGDVDPTQLDADADGFGDACDVCPFTFNPEQRVRLDTTLAPAEVVIPGIAPDSSRAVFLAQQNDVAELYSIPLAGGARVKLNGALVPGGNVIHYLIAANGSRVVYLADQDTNDVFELYSVPLAGGVPVKLNGALVAGGDVFENFVIAPANSYVVYTADQDTDGIRELYNVPLTGGVSLKLNGALVPRGNVSTSPPLIAPDSSRVVYSASQDTAVVEELYSVPLAGGTPVKLNGTLVAGGNISYFGLYVVIAPNSSRVVYLADQDTNDVFELYSVPLAGGVSVKLNGALAAGGDAITFAIAADSSRVVYLADQDTDDADELYSVSLAGGTPVKLNGALVPGGDVFSTFVSAPDSSRVVYLADQDTNDVAELYGVPLTGGAPAKLNGPLVSGGNVFSSAIAPDSSRVVYLADQDTDLVQELYSVPLAGGTPVKLNGALVPGGNVASDLVIAADSSRVVYLADQDTDGVRELYDVPLAGGAAVKLNGSLAPGGQVELHEYRITPDSSRVVYFADQEADDIQLELYSIELHEDRDADGVADSCDLCPVAEDWDQMDADGDGFGDACDLCPDAQPGIKLSGDLLFDEEEGIDLTFAVTPDGATVVFIADPSGPFELFRAPAAGGTPVKLSGALVAGGRVASFVLSPDGSRVVYRADQDTVNDFELYSVPVSGGAPVKLNGALVAGGNVLTHCIAPDGSQVVYLADQDTDEVFELYSVPLAGGAPMKLNGALVAGGDVDQYLVSPNSSQVVYLADQETNGVEELYSVPIVGGAVVKLNGALVAGGSVYQYRIFPSSSRVVYRADQVTFDTFELYSVPLAGGAAVKLNGAMAAGGDVQDFVVGSVAGPPPTQRVVYRADQDTDNVPELYSVLVTGGTAVKLNAPLVSGGVDTYGISPNNSRVAYTAGTIEAELYSVPLGGGASIKLSGALVAGGYVDTFAIAPDSSRVAYRADQDTVGVPELYSVPLLGGTAVKLSGALVPGGYVYTFTIAPDSSRVVYLAEQDTEHPELYSVPLSGGASARINAPLVAGTVISGFVFSPDGSRAFYVYEAPGNVVELFAAQLPDDLDADTVAGYCDVCPGTADPDQADTDGDGFGDACDICPEAFDLEQRVKLSGALAFGGDVSSGFASVPNSSRVVYLADQETNGIVELFSVPVAGGAPVKLNYVLVPGGTVTSYVVALDGSRVVYLADQDTNNDAELYGVPVSGGAPVKLNGTLVPGGDVSSYAIAPDGSRVVYTASQDTGVSELYSVPLAGGASVKLNGALVPGGRVFGAGVIAPDSSRVVYRADQDTVNVDELYSVPLAGGAAVKLNGALVSGGRVVGAGVIAPDSSRVVYFADQDTDDVNELYSVPLTGGVPVKLNGALVPGGDVFSNFVIAADSARVVYGAAQDTDNINELYSVPLTGGASVKLNGVLVPAGGVFSHLLAADSSRAVYLADQDTDGISELYSVPLTGGISVKLNGALVPGGLVVSYVLAPNSARVVYRAAQDTFNVTELYSVPLAGGVAVKLNGAFVPEGDSILFHITADGSRVVYSADQDTDNVTELYNVPLAGGTAVKVSGPLVAGGSVGQFVLTPDSSRAIYTADADVNEVSELFSVELYDDDDGDAVASSCDVCPDTPDPGQADGDGDGVGDLCDNCPLIPNPAQGPCVPDTTSPTVIGVVPADGFLDAALSTHALLLLSEPIDPGSATSSSFFLEVEGVKVAGSVRIGAGGTWASFDPEGSLQPDTAYTVRLTHELQDLAGNPAIPFTSTFDTVGSASSSALPADDIGKKAAGKAIQGRHPGDHAGYSVAALGDVNADTTADLLVGAPDAEPGGLAGAGSAMLVFGERELQSNASAARVLEYLGEEAGQATGLAVARGGDLNGDGRADFVIGAPYSDSNGADSGKVYVVFGHAGLDELAPGALNLADLAACLVPTLCGIVFEGAAADDLAGAAVSFGGDLNNDAKDDLLIGAPGASPGGRVGAGKVYVIHGPLAATGTPIDLATAGSTTPGLVLHGEEPGDEAGAALSGWFDTGAGGSDGLDDLLIGAPGAAVLDPWDSPIPDAGIVYAVRGGPLNLAGEAAAGVIELSRTPTDVSGYIFLGTLQNARLGDSLTGAVDTDADGQLDIYIGGTDAVWFISGGGPKTISGSSGAGQNTGVDIQRRELEPGDAIVDLGAVVYTPGLDGSPGRLAVGPGGDVNADGVEDVVIGAAGADSPGKTDAGKAYIVYGNPVRGPSVVLLSDVGVGEPGLVVEGRDPADGLGQSVGGGFDLNADGIDDALAGAPFADPLAVPVVDARGESYVISPVAPDEVALLLLERAGSTATLEWTVPHRALRYNVYRGLLSALLAAGQVRTSDMTPACGITTDADTDMLPDTTHAGTPPAGDAFFYLVTGWNLTGEGPLGPPGYAGVNDAQCP